MSNPSPRNEPIPTPINCGPTAAPNASLDDQFELIGRQMFYMFCAACNLHAAARLASDTGDFDASRAQGLADAIAGVTQQINGPIRQQAFPHTSEPFRNLVRSAALSHEIQLDRPDTDESRDKSDGK